VCDQDHLADMGQTAAPKGVSRREFAAMGAAATALAIARSQESRVWGVQLATSEHLVDQSILSGMGGFVPTGVNPQLVWNVRNALDAEGFGDIKILMSGSVTVSRIREFEDNGVPVDAYGVGSALTSGRFSFVADVVMLDDNIGHWPQVEAPDAVLENFLAFVDRVIAPQ